MLLTRLGSNVPRFTLHVSTSDVPEDLLVRICHATAIVAPDTIMH